MADFKSFAALRTAINFLRNPPSLSCQQLYDLSTLLLVEAISQHFFVPTLLYPNPPISHTLLYPIPSYIPTFLCLSALPLPRDTIYVYIRIYTYIYVYISIYTYIYVYIRICLELRVPLNTTFTDGKAFKLINLKCDLQIRSDYI